MADDPYRRLCTFLDQFPLGFPRTASGVEMRILKRLFTEDEAKTVTCLSPIAEEVSLIASRLNVDERNLTEKLESLADKGLIFRIRRGDRTFFNAVPFMIGLYEYSVQDMDVSLAALYREYYEEAYQAEMAMSNVPGFKVIPIGHTVAEEMALIPSCKLEEQVRKARIISVAPCICRKEARLAGKAAAGRRRPVSTSGRRLNSTSRTGSADRSAPKRPS